MVLPFTKYQGAGNDFILFNQWEEEAIAKTDNDLIARLCDRRFGIGADGLMFLRKHTDYDFEMVYFNADGQEGSMCGNGGRCIVAFAHHLGLIGDKTNFLAIDGPHAARVIRPDWVELQMQEVREVEQGDDFFFLDTGSPHYVQLVADLSGVNIVEKGRAIRYSDRFREKGTNVNFVERQDKGLTIGTYERGVEDETLACGTGITAAALVSSFLPEGYPRAGAHTVPVRAKGGELEVRFAWNNKRFSDIWLCGPATRVFSGQVVIH